MPGEQLQQVSEVCAVDPASTDHVSSSVMHDADCLLVGRPSVTSLDDHRP